MKEEWRDINGYIGYYQISDKGRVKSVKRKIKRSNGRVYSVSERILKSATNKSGYPRVSLSKEKSRTHRVHRLVAVAFLLSKENKFEVNHINGAKHDNFLENLEWVTSSENMIHAYKNKLRLPMIGENNPSAKINKFQALTIKTLLMSGFGPSKISKMYDISVHIIKDISRKRTWKHVNA